MQEPATLDVNTLSLHDALPISGDAVGILCGGQVGGKGCAHHLFQRERFLRVRARHENQQSHYAEQRMTLHQRSEEHTSELQSRENIVCRLLLEEKIETI